MKNRLLLTIVSLLTLALPVSAAIQKIPDGFDVKAGKVGLKADKVQLRSSGGDGVITIKYADSDDDSRTYTWPDAGANAAPVMTAGNQTIAGTKTFSTLPVIPSSSIKREIGLVRVSPETGACADSTIYRGYIPFGRAGTIKKVNIVCGTHPTVGTDTIKVRKNSVSGNNVLLADFDANTLTDATISSPTLTNTGADLVLTATDSVYVEYSAGTQTVDAVNVNVSVEFEPDDF